MTVNNTIKEEGLSRNNFCANSPDVPGQSRLKKRGVIYD